jgi:hypothetical protein
MTVSKKFGLLAVLICLIFQVVFSWTFTNHANFSSSFSKTEWILNNQPFSFIKSTHLLGYFPFDVDVSNSLLSLDSSYQTTYVTAEKKRIVFSQDAMDGNSLYTSSDIFLSTSIPVDPKISPVLTIGGWIKVSSAADGSEIINRM